ncbi:TlpA disulfide reductase family protein [Flammeovirga sp. EKP202]|uniref:TlpA family protein disulfide reductase n=1 Tax=Flammeovirga sp. EKP202 TaxID=2770592 RepID=UPI00165FBD55|nr:TlpA disulfide reductase family protein [Flammeovirga sp. EKP202]MBD0400689.1 TlpA family protein disulfide reductase [Flammeovirga sp. EKP202]
MTSFIKYALSIITFFIVISCNQSPKLVLQADEVIQLEQQEVLKFNKFDGLSPLFSHKDDTLRVINFWATWCKPCVKELPYFQQLDEKFKKNGEKAKVILISLDMNEKNLSNYIKKKNLTTSTFWLDDPDANAWLGRVNENWDGAIPVTLTIDKNKTVFHNTDFHDYEELEKFISQ